MKGQKRTPLICGNPIIEQHLLSKSRRKHEEALRHARASIDSTPPFSLSHKKENSLHRVFVKREERRAKSEDTKMVLAISKTMKREFSMTQPVGPTSLNLIRRKHELRDITSANLKLLHKLESVKSEYAAAKLETDYRHSLKYSLNSSFSLRKLCEEVVRDVREQGKKI